MKTNLMNSVWSGRLAMLVLCCGLPLLAAAAEKPALSEAEVALKTARAEEAVREVARATDPDKVWEKADAAAEALEPVLKLGDNAGPKAWRAAGMLAIASENPELFRRA
jgi:hypothetical protein